MSWSWIPRPPNPESGDGLWLLAWPLVHTASNLVELWEIRLVLGGIVAPAAFAAVWGFLGIEASVLRRWVASISAGLFVATDPGLVDTLISGARSYGAPELIGLATAAGAFALRGHVWAGVVSAICLVLATDHHPLAAGMIIGAALASAQLKQAMGTRGLAVAAGAALLTGLPRLIRTAAQALCGEGPVACLATIAQSNVGPELDRMAMISEALHDRMAVDLGGYWPALVLGLLLCLQRPTTRTAGGWVFGGLAGILLLGITIGYVRPYHLRILAVPLAAAAALGLSRWWPVCLVTAGAASIWGWSARPVGPDPGALARADHIAEVISGIEGPLWVDQVWWDGPPRVDAPAVVLSAVLQGTDPDTFVLAPDATMILLTSAGPPAPWPPLIEGPGWRVHPATNLVAVQAWVKGRANPPHSKGGALDWATALHPNTTSAEDAAW